MRKSVLLRYRCRTNCISSRLTVFIIKNPKTKVSNAALNGIPKGSGTVMGMARWPWESVWVDVIPISSMPCPCV